MLRASRCSIAATSRPVRRAASRSAPARAIALRSDSTGTQTSAVRGAGATIANVTAVITPSVPSDPTNRSMRSMPGAAK